MLLSHFCWITRWSCFVRVVILRATDFNYMLFLFNIISKTRSFVLFSCQIKNNLSKCLARKGNFLACPAFSSRFVDFVVQRGATLKSDLTVTRFFSTNHNSLLRMATNEIASFCIVHRSRQMAFFRANSGQKAGFRVMLKYFEIKKGFSLLYKTNSFQVAVRLIQ